MMKKSLSLLLSALALLSCANDTEQLIESGKRILLDVDAERIEKKIKSVSLLQFEVDDSWKYITAPLMTKCGDTFIFCTQETCHLIGYKESGKKVFFKHIKGRGRGEVLEIMNMFSHGDTVCLYDVSKGNLVMYDKQGRYFSKTDDTFMEEYLYPMGKGKYVGFTALRNRGNKYVNVYDEDGNKTDSYFSMPDYLKGLSYTIGQTPMQYSFKDSVRFRIPFDYNLYSVTERGIESVYKFVPANPIPQDVLEKIGKDMPVLERIQLVGKYDYNFQSLFEMDRFLFFYYSGNHVLYDKQKDVVFKTLNPKAYYDKSFASDMSCDDVWQYILSSFLPLYSEGNRLYGRLPSSFYGILNDCKDKLDSRQMALLNEMADYYSKYTVLSDDVLIVSIDFEE